MKTIRFSKTKDDENEIVFTFSDNKSILNIEINTNKYEDPYDVIANVSIDLNVFETKQLIDFLNNSK